MLQRRVAFVRDDDLAAGDEPVLHPGAFPAPTGRTVLSREVCQQMEIGLVGCHAALMFFAEFLGRDRSILRSLPKSGQRCRQRGRRFLLRFLLDGDRLDLGRGTAGLRRIGRLQPKPGQFCANLPLDVS